MTEMIEELERKLATATSDDERIDHLIDIGFQLHRSEPVRALEYAEKARLLASSSRDKTRLGISLRTIGACKGMLNDFSGALASLDIALALFEETGDRKRFADTLHTMGVARYSGGHYSDSIELLSRALAMRVELGDRIGQGNTLHSLGLSFKRTGDLVAATRSWLQSLRLFEEEGAEGLVGTVYTAIGTMFHMLGNMERAFHYYSRGIERHSEHDRDGLFFACLSIGEACRSEKRFEQGIEYLERARELARSMGNESSVAEAETMLGLLHAGRGEPEIGLEHVRSAQRLVETFQHYDTTRYNVFAALGRIHLLLFRYDESLQALRTALEIAERLESPEMEWEIHEILSRYHQQAGNAAKAIEHYRRHVEIDEAMLGPAQQRTLTELQIRIEIERGEREKEIYRLKSARLEMEVEQKTKELTAMALHLVEKNQFLGAIKKQLSDTLATCDAATRPAIRVLLREVQENIDADVHWNAFQTQFEQLHHDFIRRLSQSHPSLTRTELKVCALLKINLSSKEIANVLYTSYKNVESHRYRIRKKLDIPADQTLTTYFTSF